MSVSLQIEGVCFCSAITEEHHPLLPSLPSSPPLCSVRESVHLPPSSATFVLFAFALVVSLLIRHLQACQY